MIGEGLRVAVGVALMFSPGTPKETEINHPVPVAQERPLQAVLPEPLRIPGPAVIKEKIDPTGPKPPQMVLPTKRHTRVRFT